MAGAGLNLKSLAMSLFEAGAVRGMQLDIHNKTVDFFTYRPGGASTVDGGNKLLLDMPCSNSRYLVPEQRDFFAVTLR